MKEQLLGVLEEIRPDLDWEAEKQLIDGGVLDSFDIVSIVGALLRNSLLRYQRRRLRTPRERSKGGVRGKYRALLFDKGESVPAEIPAGRVLIYRGMLPGRTEHMRGAFRSDEQGDILRREQNRARR